MAQCQAVPVTAGSTPLQQWHAHSIWPLSRAQTIVWLWDVEPEMQSLWCASVPAAPVKGLPLQAKYHELSPPTHLRDSHRQVCVCVCRWLSKACMNGARACTNKRSLLGMADRPPAGSTHHLGKIWVVSALKTHAFLSYVSACDKDVYLQEPCSHLPCFFSEASVPFFYTCALGRRSNSKSRLGSPEMQSFFHLRPVPLGVLERCERLRKHARICISGNISVANPKTKTSIVLSFLLELLTLTSLCADNSDVCLQSWGWCGGAGLYLCMSLQLSSAPCAPSGEATIGWTPSRAGDAQAL